MAGTGRRADVPGASSTRRRGGLSVGDAPSWALLAIPLGYWIYIGFTYSAYIGGEVKQASKTQPRMILATLVFAYPVYMLIFWRYYEVVGKDFTNSVVYLDAKTTRLGLPVSPVTELLRGDHDRQHGRERAHRRHLHPLARATPLRDRNGLHAEPFRLVVRRRDAQAARDGVRADARPWVSALVITIVAAVLLALYVFTSFFTIVVNYIVIFSIAFWMASFAAILLPYSGPDLFNQAPDAARRRIGGIPVISILGFGNLALFTLILVASFKTPAFSGPTGGRAIAFVVGIYVVGADLYFVSLGNPAAPRGVDLDLLYKEIPPE